MERRKIDGQLDERIVVVVPINERARGIKAKLDAQLHFSNEPGAMEDFIAFCDRMRERGLEVGLRTSADNRYPVADVSADQDGYSLTVFGPHYTTADEDERDHGEDATRLAIAARIALDKAE